MDGRRALAGESFGFACGDRTCSVPSTPAITTPRRSPSGIGCISTRGNPNDPIVLIWVDSNDGRDVRGRGRLCRSRATKLGVRSDASRRRRHWISREPLDPCQPRPVLGPPMRLPPAQTPTARSASAPSPRRPVEIAPTWSSFAPIQVGLTESLIGHCRKRSFFFLSTRWLGKSRPSCPRPWTACRGGACSR